MKTTSSFNHTPPQEVSPSLSFCQTYSLEEAQILLWQCLQPCLLAALRSGQNSARLIAFCEHLERLLPALYTTPYPDQKESSIAQALDTLHEQLTQDWVLLICPPD
ncbi:hypothetical protein [Pontibacter actiniarum]|uniref:Uncharacterized protein n=1 Tax=Pontibacter actiniarum TaxID=323450 RepID=A0A1X9YSF7_9BACT|nr:hypothetical protein [Pontibacter actiniarum]ARS35798.1 hypothetical protein CA264_10280 [Pontibacter actiniarum]